MCLVAFGQKNARFRESEFLKLDNGYFVSLKKDSTVRLKYRVLKDFKQTETGFSISKGDTTFHYTREREKEYEDFKAADFGLEGQKRLYGDFVQDGKLVKFYPWRFKNNDSIEKKLGKHDYYVLEIPNRTVVKVNYRAWQYGTLTLPLKFYSKSRDSLGNFDLGANLNFMIGRNWGKKKYSYLGGKAKDSFTLTQSINLVVGINELDLTEDNTNKALSKEISTASFSYGCAYGVQYKKVGVFFALGWDTPLSKYGKKWVYKDVMWFGIGVGLGL